MSESAGRVLMIPKGTYSPTTTYDPLDAVKYGHNSYVCKQTSRGNLPTNTTYWQPLTDVTADEVPTEGSTNLVQSGGVYSAIDTVNQTLTSAFANNVNENGCKNVLRVINKTTANYANIIYTPNSDGSISVSNTKASAIADYYLFAPDNKNENSIIPLGNDLERDVDYVLSTGRLSNAGVRLIINLYDKDKAGLGVLFETQTHATFNLSTLDPNNLAAYYRIYLRVSSGATPVDNAVIYPMICLKSDYDLDPTYAPPSKTNRQLTEDSVTWDDYSKLGSVNLLDITGTTSVSHGITFTVNDKTINVTGDGDAGGTNPYLVANPGFTLPKGTYKLSGCPSGQSLQTAWLFLRTLSGEQIGNETGNGLVFTVTDETVVYQLRVYAYNRASNLNLTFKPMIAPLSYNGPYVPYAKTNRELTELVGEYPLKWKQYKSSIQLFDILANGETNTIHFAYASLVYVGEQTLAALLSMGNYSSVEVYKYDQYVQNIKIIGMGNCAFGYTSPTDTTIKLCVIKSTGTTEVILTKP